MTIGQYYLDVLSNTTCRLSPTHWDIWHLDHNAFLLVTRKYPLRGYILGSGAPGTPGATPKTFGATFISELRHLELLMG